MNVHTRMDVAAAIAEYICELPPAHSSPNRITVTIDYPNSTERHLIFEEVEP